MNSVSETIDRPLTPAALSTRYRELCADPLLANVPGTIELDIWGRILMSPANNYHGILQMRLGRRFDPSSGTAMAETSVLTSIGVIVADVAWGSRDFMRQHGTETPFTRAPEICVEIASPSNSTQALTDKVAAYLDAGAVEAWVVYPMSKRIEFFTAAGTQADSNFEVDLTNLLD